MNFVRNWMKQLLDTLSDEQMMHQPVAGANHAVWIIGHSAWCDDEFLSSLGGTKKTSPANWKGIFGNGSTPSSKTGDYPSVAKLRGALDSNREAFVKWVEGMDDAKLAEALPEDLQSFAPTYRALIAMLAATSVRTSGS